jgi:hypothetical protein
VEDVRPGPHPTGGQTLGGRSRVTGALPSLSLRRLGMHRGADPGGKAFALITVLPMLVVTAWLLAGLPLLLAGRFLPVPMVLITVPVAVGLVLMTGRQLPGRWPGPVPGPRPGRRAGPTGGGWRERWRWPPDSPSGSSGLIRPS